VIGNTISHYKILARLGAGGMGVVYEAEDTRLGRKVAIKFLPEDAQAGAEAGQRFEREARVVSTLNHPHICTLFDIGLHQGKQFMVMELLEGQSLKDRVARGPLPVEEVLDLGAQMADALDAAHAQGVVHRDIKPANLFVTRRATLKVLDFGVAKLGQPAPAAAGPLDSTLGATDQLTTLGTTIGTVSYMSPEQARGQEIDARSDVFSAGVVLYEMATGRLPFPGATVATIFEGLLTRPPEAPSQVRAGLPAEFDHIVFKALEKDRETRYQSAAEMRADLKRLKRSLDTGHVTAATAAMPAASRPAPPAAAAPRRSRLPWLVGAPVVTAAVVAGLFFYRSITTPALTERDSVVLASLTNRTGDAMFDDTLGEALGLQLRQSPFLNLAPEPQVQSTLRLMGRDPSTEVTLDVGREICQRTGGKAVLGGAIAMLGSSYVITLSAQDCVEGRVLAEEQVQAPSKEAVLGALGAAVTSFREKLGESLASVQRYDARIEEATTPSLEALKAYTQGMTTRRIQGDFDSVPFFLRAIELDPDFALAHARLGTVYSNLGRTDDAKRHATRAYELRQRVGDRERLYIEARYHSTVTNDTDAAINAYTLLIAAYPTDYAAHSNLGTLVRPRDVERAVASFEEAIRLAPDQPIAYGNLASAYTDLQRYEDSRRTYEALLKLQEHSGARAGLYALGIITGDQALADAQVSAMSGHRDEAQMTGMRIQAAAFRGRFAEAAELTPLLLRQLEQTSRRNQAGQAIMSLAISEAMVGLHDRARARVEELGDQDLLTPATADEQLVVAAITGNPAEARRVLPDALLQAETLPSTFREENQRFLRALAVLAGGDAAAALAAMGPMPFQPPYTEAILLQAWMFAGAGRHDEAAKALAWLDSKDARLGFGVLQPYVRARLGLELAALGRAAEARAAFEQFFTQWKDADADIPLLLDARAAFARLTGS
jgi:eukaryotic-like serine/threonine-protein kinase